MDKKRKVCLNNDMIVCQVDKDSLVLASVMSSDTHTGGNLIEKMPP